MTERERELRQRMAVKTEEIRNLLQANQLDEAEAATNELRNMKRELTIMQTVEDMADTPPFTPVAPSVPEDTVDVHHVVAQMLRHGILTDAEMTYARSIVNAAGNLNEGTPGQGGYIVPADAQTRINELKRTLNPLSAIVRVENVSTVSGTRVLESAADITAFASVEELAKIGETDAPTFTQLSYKVKKYAGVLPVSKELLADTDQNLLDYVYRWLAKKSVVTENARIVAVLKTLSKTALTDLDSIKGVFNVTLDPAIALQSVVVTNQDGFNYLDCLKDKDGDYLLQANPLNPTQKLLFGHPITIVSNKSLPTDTASGKKAPVLIGSMADAVVLFDRQATTLEGTSVGGDSFLRDSYDIKAILRMDVQKFDPQAAVFGELTLA